MDTPHDKKTLVSAIIPAFNEADRIGAVLQVVCNHPLIGEVIVVDDGSTDTTAEVALQFTPHVITLEANKGKAHAMDVGVSQAQYDFLFFLDADIINFTKEMVDILVEPVVSGRYAMYAGLRDKKIYWVNKFVRMSPIITGERVLTREVWNAVPQHYKQNFQIEIALNFYAKKTPHGMGFELMPNLTHRAKEKKYGFLYGQYRRLGMMKDIVWVALKVYIWENIKYCYINK